MEHIYVDPKTGHELQDGYHLLSSSRRGPAAPRTTTALRASEFLSKSLRNSQAQGNHLVRTMQGTRDMAMNPTERTVRDSMYQHQAASAFLYPTPPPVVTFGAKQDYLVSMDRVAALPRPARSTQLEQNLPPQLATGRQRLRDQLSRPSTSNQLQLVRYGVGGPQELGWDQGQPNSLYRTGKLRYLARPASEGSSKFERFFKPLSTADLDNRKAIGHSFDLRSLIECETEWLRTSGLEVAQVSKAWDKDITAVARGTVQMKFTEPQTMT